MNLKQIDEAFRVSLKHHMAELGYGGQTKIAKHLGVTSGYIHQLLNNMGYGSEVHRRQIAAYFGFSSYDDFLEFGLAILENRPPPKPEANYLSSNELSERRFLTVPFSTTMKLAAGGGGVPIDYNEEVSDIVIHGPTLGYRTADNLQAFRVGGDSMEPEIAEGGIVLVDKTITRLDDSRFREGSIYMLCYEADGVCAVKRLRWAEEGRTLAIESTNPAFPTVYKKIKEIYNLVGKVVWAWREFE